VATQTQQRGRWISSGEGRRITRRTLMSPERKSAPASPAGHHFPLCTRGRTVGHRSRRARAGHDREGSCSDGSPQTASGKSVLADQTMVALFDTRPIPASPAVGLATAGYSITGALRSWRELVCPPRLNVACYGHDFDRGDFGARLPVRAGTNVVIRVLVP
jgi:hypothetical protein